MGLLRTESNWFLCSCLLLRPGFFPFSETFIWAENPKYSMESRTGEETDSYSKEMPQLCFPNLSLKSAHITPRRINSSTHTISQRIYFAKGALTSQVAYSLKYLGMMHIIFFFPRVFRRGFLTAGTHFPSRPCQGPECGCPLKQIIPLHWNRHTYSNSISTSISPLALN